MLLSYCDALTDRWQPVAPASSWVTVIQRNLNTALLVMCGMERHISTYQPSPTAPHGARHPLESGGKSTKAACRTGAGPRGATLPDSHVVNARETIGALSHRPIVLTDTIDYRTIGFSHNHPHPTKKASRRLLQAINIANK